MLSPPQAQTLYDLLVAELVTANFELPESGESEPEYTSRVLLPWVRTWVQTLQHPGLYVRGDGGPAIAPVVWNEMEFYPDIAIVDFAAKYVAFEVKLLRNIDAGGAAAKAIGQTTIYSAAGYLFSVALIIDCRRSQKSGIADLKFNLDLDKQSRVFVFSP